MKKLNQTWLQNIVTPVLRRQRQEDCYKFSLDYTDDPHPSPHRRWHNGQNIHCINITPNQQGACLFCSLVAVCRQYRMMAQGFGFRFILDLRWLSLPFVQFSVPGPLSSWLISCAQQPGMYNLSTTQKSDSGFLDSSKSSFCFHCLPTSDPSLDPGWLLPTLEFKWDTQNTAIQTCIWAYGPGGTSSLRLPGYTLS